MKIDTTMRGAVAQTVVGATLALLVACGGGGAGGQGEGPLPGSVPEGQGGTPPVVDIGASSPSFVQLVATNSFTLPSDGRTPVELEAYVVDRNNVVLPDQVVTFGAIDAVSPPGVRLEVTDGGKTDATGRASARLMLFGNPANRSVTVAAKAGALSSQPIVIDVAGTSLAISGPSAITHGGSADYTISVRDSGGSPGRSQELTVTSGKGNVISAPKVTTGTSGQASVQVIATLAGTDTLTVEGAGTSATFLVEVSDRSLTFASSAASRLPIASTPSTFTINYAQLGGIPAGTWAKLSTTRGTITPLDVDISSGTATFSVTSPHSGLAKLTATAGNVTATWPVTFFATTPAAINIQASPQIISANVANSTDQRSSLYMTVRDASGNPVPARRLALRTPNDPSGGSIDPPVVVTDASGRAEASFIAGPNVTAPNAVTFVARDLDASPMLQSQPAALTVSRRELFVRVQTGNSVESSDSPPVYRKRFAVVVTDSAGNGIDAVSIQAKLIPVFYREGTWVPGPQGWRENITRSSPSEDANYDGVCQAGEDANLDGYLTPGNVASVSGAAATGADGIAELVVTYPKGFANWVEVILEVTGRSAGTENQTAQRFWLPVAAADIANVQASPPGGESSPFPYPRDAAPSYPEVPTSSCPMP